MSLSTIAPMNGCEVMFILTRSNTIENVFNLFKRSVVGSYHKVSRKHLDAYLDELEWRFNNRDNLHLFRDTLLKLIMSENLPYESLTKT